MKSYKGDAYLDFEQVEAWCRQAVDAIPRWASVESVGESLLGRPMLLITLGLDDARRDSRPAFWLDAGTHASEFTGVMAALYTLNRWVEALAAGDADTEAWFSRHTVYVMPCISPDGFHAMCHGSPFMRSTLRPPRDGEVRVGLSPQDMDGDGDILQMRWKHPAGSFVVSEEDPRVMRPRRVGDAPEDAWFVASEGQFLAWDGVSWTRASHLHGLDLNRNFPGSWRPFSMFGMDGGAYPTSAPESRAVVEAFAARANICAAVTHHTYSGCILTQPYRAETPLHKGDIDLMEALARDAVLDTDYDVFKVNPGFTYDPKQSITGVWADTMTTTFGVPGYTVELWSPVRWAGLETDPMDFLLNQKPEDTLALVRQAIKEDLWHDWRPFEHPQLGPVELGGLKYLETVRNPPLPRLPEECRKGHAIVEAVRQALPRVEVTTRVASLGHGHWRLDVILENLGFLPSSALAHGENLQGTPAVSVKIEGQGVQCLSGDLEQSLHHLDGWGQTRVGAARNPVYAGLPLRGHRAVASWTLKADAGTSATLRWIAGRAGRGELTVVLEEGDS